jgi:TatD DNase family protein
MQHNRITHAVQIGCDVRTSRQAISLHERYPGIFLPTIGYHPEHAQHASLEEAEVELEILERMLLEHRESIVAIGETGLDYHYLSEKRKEEIEVQEYVWRVQ